MAKAKTKRVKIGTRLSQVLEERNLQQKELISMAEPLLKERGLKLGPSKLSQYVTNQHGPDTDMIELLAEVLGEEPGWLSGLSNIRKPVSIEDGLDDLDRELMNTIRHMSRESKLSLLAGLRYAKEEKE